MWTRSKTKVVKEDPNFKTLDAPKRKTLINSKSLSNINNLESSFKPIPFNLHIKTNLSKMANPAQDIYLAWDNGVPLALAMLHDIPTNIFITLLEFNATS